MTRAVDSGSAHIVKDNREFNAIAFATQRPDGGGEFLRGRSEKNRWDGETEMQADHCAGVD